MWPRPRSGHQLLDRRYGAGERRGGESGGGGQGSVRAGRLGPEQLAAQLLPPASPGSCSWLPTPTHHN